MVEFFNKKEDVIDLQLTEYGKYLLSLGRLRPEYYAFFDDDILYDPECGGFTEHQNSTEGRIKDETPSLKIVPQITSAETRVNQFVGNVQSYREARLSTELMAAYARGEISDAQLLAYLDELETSPGESTYAGWSGILADPLAFDQQPFRRTPLSNIDPLGNSSLAKSYAPSWSIEAAIGEISSSANSITVRNASYNVPPSTPAGTDGQAIARVPGPVHEIPQLNIEIDYKTFTKSGNYTVEAISPELNGSVFLAMRPGYFLIDILEENTDYLKENFEIEVFHSGAATYDNDRNAVHLQPGPPDAPALTSLTFLEDSSIATPQNMNDGQVPNVEYYMDVLTDKEIPDSILSYAGVLDSAVSQASTRLRLTRDLYTTENEEPCD
jgi:hypothetical protein